MASKTKNKPTHLKTQNAAVVTLFILWCLAIYAAFFAGLDLFWSNLQLKFHSLNKKDGLALTMMPILVLVLSGLVSSSAKAQLVFWRFKNALPGHRVFSKLAPKDPRINMSELRRKLAGLPRGAKDQNTTWFKLYKAHESATTVRHSHRLFLLARDLATISLLCSIFGTFGLLVGGVGLTTLLYLALMIAQYILFAIVAQNHANRMVCNVLVEHLSK